MDSNRACVLLCSGANVQGISQGNLGDKVCHAVGYGGHGHLVRIGGASRGESPTETGHDYAKEREPTSEPLKRGFPKFSGVPTMLTRWSSAFRSEQGTPALGNAPMSQLNNVMAL